MNSELAPVAQMLMGYLVQWTRGAKAIPNWVGYAVLVVGTIAIYGWMTPDFSKLYHTNWRLLVAQMLSFFLAARGSASLSSDAKAAPKTAVTPTEAP